MEDRITTTALKPACNGDSLIFAQLSDPHLSTLDAVRFTDLISKRLLGYLSWRHKRSKEHRSEVLAALVRDLLPTRPDHVVVTGDLTNIGLPEEFRQARKWLETLGKGGEVTVIPGNHDAYARSRWDSRFTPWAPYMTSDKIPSASILNEPGAGFPLIRIRGPVVFIGLSSARPSAPFLATGTLGAEQLDRLSRLLREIGRLGLFRVLLLHHPPRPGDDKWRKRLTDASQLCSIIAEYGAELVLHGHTHRFVRAELETPAGKAPVFGIPSASADGHRAERRAGYNLYRVVRADAGWELGISVRGYLRNNKSFCHQQDQHLVLPLSA